MNSEQKAYLEKLADLIAQGKTLLAISLCYDSGVNFDWICWRIVPEKDGVSFQMIGHYESGNFSSDSRFLNVSFPSIYQIFGNMPLDPMLFVQDSNQENDV